MALAKKKAKKRAEKTTAKPLAPLDWDDSISFRQWFPDEAVQAKVRAGIAAAMKKKKSSDRNKALVSVAALFPPELLELIKDDVSTGVYAVEQYPSPQVTKLAMKLLASAAKTMTPAEVEAIEPTLTRILPNLPGLCLPFVLGFDTYIAAVEKCRARAIREMGSPVSSALDSLDCYLTDS
jgi:hypothetical protein